MGRIENQNAGNQETDVRAEKGIENTSRIEPEDGLEFLDLFSGIGGFRRGLERSGHKCVGHVEIDKYANISYMAMYGLAFCNKGNDAGKDGNSHWIYGAKKGDGCDGTGKKTAGRSANGSQKTLNCLQQEKYQKLRYGLSDFLARISPSQGNGLGLPENEVDCFLRLLVCSKAQRPKISPESLSLRTLSIFCQAAAEGILPPFSLTYGKLGMTQNGSVSIQRISEYPRTGKSVHCWISWRKAWTKSISSRRSKRSGC